MLKSLRSCCGKEGLESIVREYIFEGEPYVFCEAPSVYELLRRHLNEATGTREENITVVGSGKIGFSLSPDTFPRQFSEESDIDVVVVNEELFDRLWVALLKWHYPRREHQPWPRDDRVAISRALKQYGYLRVTRRLVTPPVKPGSAASLPDRPQLLCNLPPGY